MESDYHGQIWTTYILCKEGATLSVIHRWISASCRQKAPARSTVFNWIRSFSNDKRTAQEAVSEWYCSTPSVVPGSRPEAHSEMAVMG